MRVLLLMQHALLTGHMRTVRTGVGEFFAAALALVWLFTGVNTHMLFQVMLELELLPAVLVFAQEAPQPAITKII